MQTVHYENKWWVKETLIYSKKYTKQLNFLINLTIMKQNAQ